MAFDSPVGVGDILSAFADDDYWQARLAAFENGTATLNGLTVEPSGAVTVDLAVKLFADRLPTAVTKLAGGEFGMARIERWSWIDDERACGAIEVAVPRAPVTAHGDVLLTPSPTGSQLRFSTTVDVAVPLVGGFIENFIIGRLGDDIGAVQRFTDAWIAANG
ncbi:DUF2505 domain-containing protein [Mycobacterium cookii]|nr:DUF2505 domain-containing protein [Mycobacterium cookii]MCV7330991.1 DUF2505 domain-containing protein [Mycobacterium cookii]